METDNPLQWRHNERDSVSNLQPHDCFIQRPYGTDVSYIDMETTLSNATISVTLYVMWTCIHIWSINSADNKPVDAIGLSYGVTPFMTKDLSKQLC